MKNRRKRQPRRFYRVLEGFGQGVEPPGAPGLGTGPSISRFLLERGQVLADFLPEPGQVLADFLPEPGQVLADFLVGRGQVLAGPSMRKRY